MRKGTACAFALGAVLALAGCTTASTTGSGYPSAGQVEDLMGKQYGQGGQATCDELGGGMFRCVIGPLTYIDVTCLTDGSCSAEYSTSDEPIQKDPYADG